MKFKCNTGHVFSSDKAYYLKKKMEWKLSLGFNS